MKPKALRVDANGGSFRGIEWPGAAPPVLLFHATGFCADVWAPLWSAAREAGADGLRAVAFDQRGHGGSFAPSQPEAYAWTRLAEDAIALAEAISEEAGGVVLVGHSSGATACLAAAGLRPERVRALAVVEPVLFDPPGRPDADSFAGSRGLAARARRRRTAFPSRSEVRRRLEARGPTAAFAPTTLEAYLAGGYARRPDGALELRCRPQIEAWAYEGAATLDVWPLVATLRAPVLVVAAEHTAMPARLLGRLEERVADLRVERVPGTTHFAALERPEPVGRTLGAFVAELRR